jgi:RNA polymerase sigma factor (sigma-70 family)
METAIARLGLVTIGVQLRIPLGGLRMTATDDELLAHQDALSFELFYDRYFARVLAFFSRRTWAADLTAETFASALSGRRRYRPHGGTADSWLFGIAYHKLADAQRRGRANDRARRRLGIERIELTDDDIARIDRTAESGAVTELVRALPAEQQQALTARVIDEREYEEIARSLRVSEAVVRKRVSRGLEALRRRMGGPT